MRFDLRKIFYAEGIFYELARGFIYFIIILILLNFFVVTINVIDGSSMEPNLISKDVIALNKISYFISSPHRGDIVALKFPGDPDKQKYIKRIIGMPNEKIEIKNSKIYINDKELIEPYAVNSPILPDMTYRIGSDEYFLIGDNRPNSNDSRSWGTARKNDLLGKGFFILYSAKPQNPKTVRTSSWGMIEPVYYNGL